MLLCLLLFAAITASLLALPIKHTPERFQVRFKHLSFNAVMRCCRSRIWAVTVFKWCHVAHEPWHVGPACSARERAFAPQLSWLKGVHGSCFRASGPLLPAHAGMWHRLHNTADSLPGERHCSQRNRRCQANQQGIKNKQRCVSATSGLLPSCRAGPPMCGLAPGCWQGWLCTPCTACTAQSSGSWSTFENGESHCTCKDGCFQLVCGACMDARLL